MLALQVYFSDVFTHHAHADQLNAGDKANDAGHASPAADGISPQHRGQAVMTRSGLMERLVIPSIANASIFDNG